MSVPGTFIDSVAMLLMGPCSATFERGPMKFIFDGREWILPLEYAPGRIERYRTAILVNNFRSGVTNEVHIWWTSWTGLIMGHAVRHRFGATGAEIRSF